MKQTSAGKEHHTRWKIIEDSIPVSSKSFFRHLNGFQASIICLKIL